ncbi:MAG: alpha/beta hydrolase fold domain-containing protein [Alphaproteobacteria bacterium]|nr:alpha/beta hydrolase fold domain-containing protein [Alphaproteobacteria bacterium]
MTETPAPAATLDPEIAAALAAEAQRFGPPLALLPHDPAGARRHYAERRAMWNEGGPAVSVRLLAVPLPGRRLEALLVEPPRPARGLLLWLHGGGWVLGSPYTHERLMRAIAVAAGCRVIGLGYRKAPEHPFPLPLEDAIEGWAWIAANRAGLCAGNADEPMAIGGDSAGANLAFGAALAAAATGVGAGAGAGAGAGVPQPDAVISGYGVLGADLDTPAYRTLGDGRFGLSRASMATYWDLYCPDAARRADPREAPNRAALGAIRRPLLVVAGLDPLRDDSRQMHARLLAHGIASALVEYPRANHGFLQLSAAVGAARDAIARIGAHLAHAFAQA